MECESLQYVLQTSRVEHKCTIHVLQNISLPLPSPRSHRRTERNADCQDLGMRYVHSPPTGNWQLAAARCSCDLIRAVLSVPSVSSVVVSLRTSQEPGSFIRAHTASQQLSTGCVGCSVRTVLIDDVIHHVDHPRGPRGPATRFVHTLP